MEAVEVPQELQHVDQIVLQDYVRQCVLAVSAQQQADAKVPSNEVTGPNTRSRSEVANDNPTKPRDPTPYAHLALLFKHDCQHSGCGDHRCLLCIQNQYRRCARNITTKVLAGDTLRAACGAAIRVEVVDRRTHEAASPADTAGVNLQFFILNAKALEDLAGVELTDADIARITLTENTSGLPLLQARGYRTGTTTATAIYPLPRGSSSLVLPDLVITGSGEALLHGQRPQFLLAVRAISATTATPIPGVPLLVSEGFVVATPRVRTAAKRDIPHVADCVGKLHHVGKATLAKLRDLKAAVAEAEGEGERLTGVPFESVTKVGEFRQLATWAEGSIKRLDALKRVLKLTKGWEEASSHAKMAVVEDTRLRVFFGDDTGTTGLLFSAKGAVPSSKPIAWLEREGIALKAHMLAATEPLPPQVHELSDAARRAWFARGPHPGWALLELDSPSFLQHFGGMERVTIPDEVAAGCRPAVPFTPGSPQGTGTSATHVVTAHHVELLHGRGGEVSVPVIQHGNSKGGGWGGLFMGQPSGGGTSSGPGAARQRNGEGGKAETQQAQQESAHGNGSLPVQPSAVPDIPVFAGKALPPGAAPQQQPGPLLGVPLEGGVGFNTVPPQAQAQMMDALQQLVGPGSVHANPQLAGIVAALQGQQQGVPVALGSDFAAQAEILTRLISTMPSIQHGSHPQHPQPPTQEQGPGSEAARLPGGGGNPFPLLGAPPGPGHPISPLQSFNSIMIQDLLRSFNERDSGGVPLLGEVGLTFPSFTSREILVALNSREEQGQQERQQSPAQNEAQPQPAVRATSPLLADLQALADTVQQGGEKSVKTLEKLLSGTNWDRLLSLNSGDMAQFLNEFAPVPETQQEPDTPVLWQPHPQPLAVQPQPPVSQGMALTTTNRKPSSPIIPALTLPSGRHSLEREHSLGNSARSGETVRRGGVRHGSDGLHVSDSVAAALRSQHAGLSMTDDDTAGEEPDRKKFRKGTYDSILRALAQQQGREPGLP